MARCIQLNRDCANICATASQFMPRDSEYSKRFALSVQMYMTNVLRNVKNILIWNTANYAPTHVEDALTNVVKWLANDTTTLFF
jgi:hypothetical protein